MHKKRAQITVFIILGVIMFFAFIFTIQLVKHFRQQKLTAAQEEILTQLFRKEGLRIYVEDCLEDALADGLKKWSTQGAIWKEDGGTREFTNDLNGVTSGGFNIAYAIKRTEYPPGDENKYPCSPSSTSSTGPCKYKHGEGSYFFGDKIFLESSLLDDLNKYIVKTITDCVKTKSKLGEFNPTSEGANFPVTLQDEGISVQVHYPVSVKAGGQDFVHLSEFSFFFPTKFKQFLDTVLTKPVDWDIQDVDFAFEPDTWPDSIVFPAEVSSTEMTDFKEKYARLGIHGTKQKDSNGDTIFEFTPNLGEDKLAGVVFRFARQNRPPALEWVERCPNQEIHTEERYTTPTVSYKYLVVQNLPDHYLNKLDISAQAYDPDEDAISVQFTADSSRDPLHPDPNLLLSDSTVGAMGSPAKLVYSNPDILSPGVYDLKITTSDTILSDEQDLDIGIRKKYAPTFSFQNLVNGNSITISREDPFCIVLTLPSNPITPPITFSFKLGEISLNDLTGGNNAFVPVRPADMQKCSLMDSTTHIFDIKTIQSSLNSKLPSTTSTLLIAEGGVIHIGTDSVCQYNANTEKIVTVQQCTPYDGDDPIHYPYPYMNDVTHPFLEALYTYKNDGTLGDLQRSPFVVPHKCCNAGSLAPSDQICFNDVLCLDNEYFLQKVVKTCGLMGRGNICAGTTTVQPSAAGVNTCGDPSKPRCKSTIPLLCKRQPEFSVIPKQGWCHGISNGCQSFCDKPVVFMGTASATSLPSGAITDVNFHCGCTGDDGRSLTGKFCDKNYNGKYGTCSAAGDCINDDTFY